MSWNGATEYTAWALLASNDTSNLTDTSSIWKNITRNGFETNCTVGGAARYVRAVALNVNGTVLGASDVLDLVDHSKTPMSGVVTSNSQDPTSTSTDSPSTASGAAAASQTGKGGANGLPVPSTGTAFILGAWALILHQGSIFQAIPRVDRPRLRANEIVNEARGLLEENAVLDAKNTFLRKGLGQQTNALKAVRRGVEHVAREGREEFSAVIKTLDAANDRLSHTLQLLKTTIVEASFLPSHVTPSQDTGDSEHADRLRVSGPDEGLENTASISPHPKTLHDFIDESTHTKLQDALRECIDNYHDAQSDLSNTAEAFDEDIQSILEALNRTPGTLSNKLARRDTNTPELFRSLEEHATEMAGLLQSLVKHYDLCVTALKHTEGGGEAAKQVQAPEIEGVESIDENAAPGPITDEERHEMLQVLERDASEVDDVVLEIHERTSDMSAQLSQLQTHVATLHTEHGNLRRALALLRKAGAALPSTIAAASAFRARWAAENAAIAARMADLSALGAFYTDFLHAYDRLLVEVGRRRAVHNRMRQIAQKAAQDMDALYSEELEVRAAFRAENGDALPSDIWPGLIDLPNRYEVLVADDGGGEIPRIRKDVLEAAAGRVRGRV
ncbi:hypothetical protein LTR04_001513 [Oleoguttula sp. CCFEE 6159]|nr:hypothetical protein LTR04_001513 [Oleoguttula sp. CCFEE 6159]